MKKITLLLTELLLIVVVVAAQETKPKSELLTSSVWRIKNSVMSGIGTHTSFPEDTELTFFADEKWKSSQPIEGSTEGTWKVSDKILTMTFSSDTTTKNYELISLSSTRLHYKIKNKTATYTYEWSAK